MRRPASCWPCCPPGSGKTARAACPAAGDTRSWEAARRLAEEHPGIEGRNVRLDLAWDILHYLLSAFRRGQWPSDENLLMDEAVMGRDALGPHCRGVQGVPVYYIAPPTVAKIAGLLAGLSCEQLRRHYAPRELEAAGVYKFWAEPADRWEWARICDYFTAFRAFYLEAVAHGEGVLVLLD